MVHGVWRVGPSACDACGGERGGEGGREGGSRAGEGGEGRGGGGTERLDAGFG